MSLQRLTIEELRAFVRGDLEQAERKSVLEKMVRCSDSDLPAVLDNLRFEFEQERFDDQLAANRRPLGQLFLKKWRRAEARVDTFSAASVERALRVASGSDEEDGREGVRLVVEAGAFDTRTFQLAVWAHRSREQIAVIVTTDDVIHVPGALSRASERSGGKLVPWRPSHRFTFERSDGRATIWYAASNDKAIFGPAVPTSWQTLHDWLARLESDPEATVDAVRLTPRVLSDYYEPE